MRISVQLLGSLLLVSACQSFDTTPVEGPVQAGQASETVLPSSSPISAHKATSYASAASSASPALSPAPAHGNELELKFAKLWARVDELENQHIQQKERMKLIEKGLLLGIIPDELKGPQKKTKPAPAAQPAEHEDEVPATSKKEQSGSSDELGRSTAPTEKSQDMGAYKQLLQQAQGKFNAAQYGQAIVHFNEIGERFDDSLTEGSQNYWIGLSWFYLKEYQLAEQSLKLLREKYPENSWVAHARYYQAKIDQTRGLSKRALEQFTQLMEEFSSQDLGEMARMEVARMREKL